MGAVGTTNNTNGLVNALRNIKAKEESESAQNNDTYVNGKTTYYITKDGNTYYLHSDYNGSNVKLHEKWKISYANSDIKARVYVPTIKQYININSDNNLLNLLKKARGKK